MDRKQIIALDSDKEVDEINFSDEEIKKNNDIIQIEIESPLYGYQEPIMLNTQKQISVKYQKNNEDIMHIENDEDEEILNQDTTINNLNALLSSSMITEKILLNTESLTNDIIYNDIPERLLIRDKLFTLKNIDDYIKHESIWITNKLLAYEKFKRNKNTLNNNHSSSLNTSTISRDKSNNNNKSLIIKRKRDIDNIEKKYREKVLTILKFLKEKHYEIMYIYTYCMNYINDNQIKLSLDILWKIYNLDYEYAQLLIQKENIFDRLKMNPEIKLSDDIKKYIDLCFDINSFNFINAFIDYELMKIHPEEVDNTILQSPFSSYTVNEFFKDKENLEIIKEFYSSSCITPNLLWANIKAKKCLHQPQTPNIIPKIKANSLLKPNTLYLSDELAILEAMCLYAALEIYHHLPLREYLIKLHWDKVLITTESTLQGKSMDIYHPLFPAKKLFKVPMKNINEDLWVLIFKSENQGNIKIKFTYPWEIEERLIIKEFILPYYIKNEDDPKSDWNTIRNEILRIYTEFFLYPCLEKAYRMNIKKNIDKYIIKQISNEFKVMLNWTINAYDNDQEVIENNIILAIVGESTNKITGSYIDKYGNYIDSFCYSVFLCSNKLTYENTILSMNRIKSEREKEYDDFIKSISKYRPNQIIIGDPLVEMKLIRNIIKAEDSTKDLNPFIYYYEQNIPRLYLKSEAIKQDESLSDYNDGVKMAMCLGRLQQDQLAEAFKLWNSIPNNNLLLELNLHPDMDILLDNEDNKKKLQQYLENMACELVNKRGIEINKMIKNMNLLSCLQFIAGIGPILAHNIINKIKKNGEYQYGNRKEIYENLDPNKKLLNGPTIIKNAIGFIKVIGAFPDGKNQFDRTRIHPDDYDKAFSIVRGAYEEYDYTTTDYLKLVQLQPYLLESIDLNDFAAQVMEHERLPYYNQVVDFMLQEIIKPFEDKRIALFQRNIKSFFYWMTGMPKCLLQEGNLLTLKIKNVYSMSLECIMDCGKIISIHKAEVYDREEKTDLKKEFCEGIYVKAKIKKIQEQDIIDDFWDIFKIDFTMKPSILRNHDMYISRLRAHFPYLKEIKLSDDDDYPLNLENTARALKFTPRKIQHPKFQNISANEATHYLADKPIGDFVIRPSTRSKDEISITWKFYHYVYITIDIKEGYKTMNDIISSQLYVGKTMYISLRSIIDEYITNGNQYVNQIITHSKFMEGESDTIKQKLQEELDKNPRILPYYLSISVLYPQYANLSYIIKNDGYIQEWIKIDHDGFHFHDSTFANIHHLIIWFKEIRKKEGYKYTLQKYIPPTRDIIEIEDEPKPINIINNNNSQFDIGWGVENIWQDRINDNNNKNNCENVNNINDDDDDVQIIENYQRYSNTNIEKRIICYNCQEYGHIASRCPNGVKTERIKRCRNCDEIGHYANSCPNPIKNNGIKRERELKCRNCSQIGHFAKDCPEKFKPRDEGWGSGARRNNNPALKDVNAWRTIDEWATTTIQNDPNKRNNSDTWAQNENDSWGVPTDRVINQIDDKTKSNSWVNQEREDNAKPATLISETWDNNPASKPISLGEDPLNQQKSSWNDSESNNQSIVHKYLQKKSNNESWGNDNFENKSKPSNIIEDISTKMTEWGVNQQPSNVIQSKDDKNKNISSSGWGDNNLIIEESKEPENSWGNDKNTSSINLEETKISLRNNENQSSWNVIDDNSTTMRKEMNTNNTGWGENSTTEWGRDNQNEGKYKSFEGDTDSNWGKNGKNFGKSQRKPEWNESNDNWNKNKKQNWGEDKSNWKDNKMRPPFRDHKNSSFEGDNPKKHIWEEKSQSPRGSKKNSAWGATDKNESGWGADDKSIWEEKSNSIWGDNKKAALRDNDKNESGWGVNEKDIVEINPDQSSTWEEKNQKSSTWGEQNQKSSSWREENQKFSHLEKENQLIIQEENKTIPILVDDNHNLLNKNKNLCNDQEEILVIHDKSPKAQGKLSDEQKESTWGNDKESQSENKLKKVNDKSSWGDARESQPENKSKKVNDKSSWDDDNSSWGNVKETQPETKAKKVNDKPNWGDDNSSWGNARESQPENKSKKGNDKLSWGDDNPSLGNAKETQPETKAKKVNDKPNWGDDNSSWGNASESKPENKSKKVNDKSSWGDDNPSWSNDKESKPENKPKKGNDKSSWGDDNPSLGNAKETQPETKAKKGNDKSSWGDNNPSWGNNNESKPDNKPKKVNDKSSWGDDDNPSWGHARESQPENKSQKANDKSSWGDDNSSWGNTKETQQDNKSIKVNNKSSWGDDNSSWNETKQSSTHINDSSKFNKGTWGDSDKASWGEQNPSWGDKSSHGEMKSNWRSNENSNWGESNIRKRGNFERKDFRNPGDTPGGRGKDCFKCGKSGHFARECPEANSKPLDSSGNKNRDCFKCGKEGHMARDCPNPGQREFKKKTCFICNEEGHISRECPNKDKFPRTRQQRRSRSRSIDKQDWRKNKISNFEKGFNNNNSGKQLKDNDDGSIRNTSSGWGNNHDQNTWGTKMKPIQETSEIDDGGWGNNNNISSIVEKTSSKVTHNHNNDGWGANNNNDKEPGETNACAMIEDKNQKVIKRGHKDGWGDSIITSW